MKTPFAAIVVLLASLTLHAQQAPDPTKWLALNVCANVNSQQECYRPSQDTVSNGFLSITAIDKAADSSHPYTSGMVASSPFNFKYGTIEYRAKMPGGQGPWPAVWMLGINCQPKNATTYNASGCNWKSPGAEELDWTEYLGGNFSSDLENIWSNQVNSPACSASLTDASKNYHIYDGVWSASSVKWYIDGVQVCEQSIPAGALTSAMYVMVNIAMGGAGGSVNAATLPQTLSMDYMRVGSGTTFTWNGTTSLPAAQANLFDDEFGGMAGPLPNAPTGLTVTVQ